jgi:hypothetical protein
MLNATPDELNEPVKEVMNWAVLLKSVEKK